MTELRAKMIRAMELKNLSHHTQRAYLAAVNGLSRHYKQTPDKITAEMIDDYLLHLKNHKKSAPNSRGTVITGLRFFYRNVMEKEIAVEYLVRKRPRKLPIVLTQKEIWAIINAPENLKHRLLLMTTMIYLHVSRETLSKIPSPLDLIDKKHAGKEDRTDDPNHKT